MASKYENIVKISLIYDDCLLQGTFLKEDTFSRIYSQELPMI